MRLVAITTCTDRKKFPVPLDLDASNLVPAPQSTISKAWRDRVQSARPVGLATDVYCGRSFQEASGAARSARADFRVISGGLGLVRGDDPIPAYSLSLVPQSTDFIGARVSNSTFDRAKWWTQIQKTQTAEPLAGLVRTNTDALVVLAISKAYLSLIARDLISLETNHLERIRLIGMGIGETCPPQLRHCILPYDVRLDGPDSPIRGTRGDFSSRAMRHFIEHIFKEHESGSIAGHHAAVNRCLSNWRHPKLISRPSRTDDEIIMIIKKNWNVIEGRSSLALRYLRDIENIACEQGRFKLLFHRAAREVRS